jgi:hypothetical protein
MKRFTFPLDRVRRWRAEQVSVEELKLQQFRAELARLAGMRQSALTELDRTEKNVLLRPSFDPIELSSLDAFRQHTRRRVLEMESWSRKCAAKIAEQRECVLEARRKRELLERLYEKALDEWRALNDREQENLAAELFLAKSVREAAEHSVERRSNPGAAGFKKSGELLDVPR